MKRLTTWTTIMLMTYVILFGLANEAFSGPAEKQDNCQKNLNAARSLISNKIGNVMSMEPVVLRAQKAARYESFQGSCAFPLLVVTRATRCALGAALEKKETKFDDVHSELKAPEYARYRKLLQKDEDVWHGVLEGNIMHTTFDRGVWNLTKYVSLPFIGIVFTGETRIQNETNGIWLSEYDPKKIKSILVYETLSAKRVGTYTGGAPATMASLGACIFHLDDFKVTAAHQFTGGPPSVVPAGSLTITGHRAAEEAIYQWIECMRVGGSSSCK